MSAKKNRKVREVPESPFMKGTYPVGSGGLDAIFGSPVGAAREPDVYDTLEIEESQELLRELREASTERRKLNLQRKIQKMKQEVEEDGGGGGTRIKGLFNFSQGDVTRLAGMTPDERASVIDTMKQLGQAALLSNPGGGGGQNAILALAASGGFSRQPQQQGMTVKDVLEIQTMMNNIRVGAGGGSDANTQSLLLTLLTQTIPELNKQSNISMQTAYNAQIAQLQANQSDPLRDIKYLKEAGEALGLTNKGASETVELKTLEMKNLWNIKEWEMHAQDLKDQREMKFVEGILNSPAIRDIAKTAGRIATARFTPNLPPEEDAAPMAPAPVRDASVRVVDPRAAPAPTSGLVSYRCPAEGCGADIIAPASQTTVICPKCGESYAVQPGGTVDYGVKRR